MQGCFQLDGLRQRGRRLGNAIGDFLPAGFEAWLPGPGP